MPQTAKKIPTLLGLHISSVIYSVYFTTFVFIFLLHLFRSPASFFFLFYLVSYIYLFLSPCIASLSFLEFRSSLSEYILKMIFYYFLFFLIFFYKKILTRSHIFIKSTDIPQRSCVSGNNHYPLIA